MQSVLLRSRVRPLLLRPGMRTALGCGVRLVHTEKRIAELGLELPAMPAPLASYTTCVRTGNLLFMAGHVPFKPDMSALVKPGKVGKDYSVQEAHDLARFIGLELVSTIKGNVGDLDKV
jgi:hypothetical protein